MAAQVVRLRIAPDGLVCKAQQLAFLHLGPGNQRGHADAKRARQAGKQGGRRATVPALDFMDHGAGDACPVGQLAQGPPARLTLQANSCANPLIHRVCYGVHDVIL